MSSYISCGRSKWRMAKKRQIVMEMYRKAKYDSGQITFNPRTPDILPPKKWSVRFGLSSSLLPITLNISIHLEELTMVIMRVMLTFSVLRDMLSLLSHWQFSGVSGHIGLISLIIKWFLLYFITPCHLVKNHCKMPKWQRK